MPLNLLKKYPELLDVSFMDEHARRRSLYAIFKRDIEDNDNFSFRGKRIYPIKTDGTIDMEREFMHLTTTDDEEAEGAEMKRRVFDMDRSRRLHWIRYHIDETKPELLTVFSCKERDFKQRKDVVRTYLYDKKEKYVIVLEPLRNKSGYFLLSAYYLNKVYGEKKIKKLIKKKLDDVV